MRWYVHRNGETAGPFSEENILHWGRTGQIVPGMLFQPETGGPWIPAEHSPFATMVSPMGRSSPSGFSAPAKVAAVIVAVGLLACGILFARVARTTKPVSTQQPREVLDQAEGTEIKSRQVRDTSTPSPAVTVDPLLPPPKAKRPPPVPTSKPNRAGAPLLCCDGTNSPSCVCSGSRKGCCSRHGGVCGCSAD